MNAKQFWPQAPRLDLTIRPLMPADIPRAGEILHQAFNEVFAAHGYPAPISDLAAGRALVTAYRDYEPTGSFVALHEGRIVGSAFLHRRGDRVGVGPVTVDPSCQGRGVGRKLMERIIEEVGDCTSIRLFQDAFNRESFALYVRLGFVVRDVMAVLRAAPPRFDADVAPGAPDPGASPGAGACLSDGRSGGAGAGSPAICREMEPWDLVNAVACDTALTGMSRPRDLAFLLDHGQAAVLEQDGGIRGFAASFLVRDTLFVGPAAAPTAAELVRLVADLTRRSGARVVSVRAPSRPGDLLQMLLQAGFEVRSLGTYMVRGRYDEPSGALLASMFPEAL